MTQNQPILDYKNPSNQGPNRPNRKFIVTLLKIVGILFLIILAIAIYFIISIHENVHRTTCAMNLRQIGQAISVYAEEHQTLPDSFITLHAATDLPDEIFICPSSNDQPANIQRQSDLVGHCSYIYLGAGQSPQWLKDPNRILACEYPENHKNAGANVLFADGHVDWLDNTQMKTLLAELLSGHNPPRDPKVAPAPSPTVPDHGNNP